MPSRIAVLLLGCLLPLSQASAQRAEPSGARPVHRDTTRGRSQDAAFFERAVFATLINAAVLAPTVAFYHSTRSEKVVVVGALTQLVLTSRAAAARSSRQCPLGDRLLLAVGGALAGVGGSILFAERRYQQEHPHEHTPTMRPFGVTALALGVPLGAAAALYDCN